MHSHDAVLTEVIESVEDGVGKITVTRGNRHTFLGMDLTFEDNGTVSINMKDYIVEVIEAFPEKIRAKATSPARANLHQVDHSSPKLDKEKAELFHSLVMKLMWVSQRCRLDISTTIAFLCTRVSKATVQDWEKLRRCLEYLNGSADDVKNC